MTTSQESSFHRFTRRDAVILLFLLLFSIAVAYNFRRAFNSYSRFSSEVIPLNTTADKELHQHPQPPSSDPPPFSDIYPIVRPRNPKRPLPYTVPEIYAIYTRRHTASSPLHDLFIYASGLSIGRLSRNISAIACLVGDVAYNIPYNPKMSFDVFKCTVREPPSPDVTVSLLLRNDQALRKALTLEPIHIGELVITLPRGVIVDPPKNLKFMVNDSLQRDHDVSTKMIASNIRWSTFPTERLPLDEFKSNPRHHVCLMTMVNSFTEYLNDWIVYHRTLGVDKVFIMDNLANHSIAEDFERWDDVEVIYWPFKLSQVQGFTYMLQAMRARCEWVIGADLDEFIITGIKGAGRVRPLAWFLRDRVSRGTHRSMFRSFEIIGNRTTASKKPMPIAYVLRDIRGHKRNGKDACRTDVDWVLLSVHECEVDETRTTIVAENGPGPLEPNHASDQPSIVHYRSRSWEEFLVKRRLGGASSTRLWNTKRKGKEPSDVYARWFGRLTENGERWTFFKKRYQTILERYDEDVQTIVWTEEDRRCEITKNLSSGRKSDVTCSGDS